MTEDDKEIRIEMIIKEIGLLQQKNKKLEARVDFLKKELDRAVEISHGFDEGLAKHCMLLSDEKSEAFERIGDAFERIKNLELKFFPHLMSDIHQLHDIIGDAGGSQGECPHERCKP